MPEKLDFIKTISREETKIMQSRIFPKLVNAYIHLELALETAEFPKSPVKANERFIY